MSSKPRIAVTMGDPTGIGPEICLRLLAEEEIATQCNPIIFGDSRVLEMVADATGLNPPNRIVDHDDWLKSDPGPGSPFVLDLKSINIEELKQGEVSAAAGKAAWNFLEKAIDAAMSERVDAITTAPINKDSMHRAGFQFPGHTEILASKTNCSRYCMMQNSDEMTATFVTCHVGLREACTIITTERVLEVIELTAQALETLPSPQSRKIVVCGLNPHAGEGGLFGEEEEEKMIRPAIQIALSKGLDVEGPIAPDTAFLPTRRANTGSFVCMYHDQGHIPLKALAFDDAVNVTLGLPIIRTSVDHGTAFDIAWKGIANHKSLLRATQLATYLAESKKYKS